MGVCDLNEGWGPWSEIRILDLTPCYELYILSNIPKLFILVVGLYILYQSTQAHRQSTQLDCHYLYYTKIGIASILFASNVALGFIDAKTLILYYTTNAIIFIFVAYLHHHEYLYSRVSSSPLLLFWLSSLIIDLVMLRTAILTSYAIHQYHLMIRVALILAAFVCECIPKQTHLYASLDQNINVTPEETANIFSRLSFYWMTPLMKLGYSKPLEMQDMWDLKQSDSAEENSKVFQGYLQRELSLKNPSLIRAMFYTFWRTLLAAAIFKFSQDVLQFTQPQLLNMIIAFAATYSPEFKEEPMPFYKGMTIAFLMLITAITQTLFLHQYFHQCFLMGMRIRSCLITAIYKKALRLSNQSRQESTIGEITNLMSVDASKIADLSTYLQILWSGPMQISIAVYFLYQTLGVSVFGGIAIMICMIPINGIIAKKSRDLNRIQMGNKDARAKLMDEILYGIKVIKLYAWEQPFYRKVQAVRETELFTLKKIAYLQALSTFAWSCTPFLVSFTTFAIHTVVSTEPLTSKKVFVSIALFNLLGFPLSAFPNTIASTIEASVSFARLLKFLMSEEGDTQAVTRIPKSLTICTTLEERVKILDGSFSWHPDGNPQVKQIELSVYDGQLYSIVGSVGSGKSTLLSAILGDTYKHSGSVIVSGSIAYIPQTPWIMNATIRDNILFGKPMDTLFYDATIEACGLTADLLCMANGDMTEIGERGINLSGGQKSRVSIARAVFSRADIYLIDDALSAVDAHVGRHIFNNVFSSSGILKNKARILVTHSIQYLSQTDQVLMLVNGEIGEVGDYKTLMARKSLLYSLIKDYGKQAIDRNEIRAIDDYKTVTKGINIHGEKDSLKPTNKRTNKIMTNEDTIKGKVDWSVYKSYTIACQRYMVIIFVSICVLGQGLSVSQNILLSKWAQQNDKTIQKVIDYEKTSVLPWLVGYGLLGLGYSSLMIVQVLFAWVYCGIRAAREMHKQLLTNVLRLPQSFFDTTPMGRVMNRFSKDQYTVDEVLPRSFLTLFRTSFVVISVLAVNTIGNPYYVLLVIPMVSIYYYSQKYYLSTSRELKRLDSMSRSPIYSNFQESLNGVTSIRAYGQERRFLDINMHKIDCNQRAYYPSISSNRWLAVRLEFIGALVVFGSASLGVTAIYLDRSVSASIVGLMLVYALSVTQTLNWMVRQSCEIETNIVSVERIKEYTEIAQEAPAHNNLLNLNPSWPQQGAISFRKFSTRYRSELELVLDNISFDIKPSEKIGICGRTGSGKSSLTLSLFRIIEATSGSIFIDGIDILEIGLFELRSRISIIPQDPVLFNGTVRENIDPFEKWDDESIWVALEKVNLKPYISSFALGLSHRILQNGENFSVGQRQLICLARKTKILVLDEATAAMDVETDSIIQKTIRVEMNECTVLTIAHRINTVLDSDRILVMERGRVAEFASPATLLKDKSSKFYSLAKESGDVE